MTPERKSNRLDFFLFSSLSSFFSKQVKKASFGKSSELSVDSNSLVNVKERGDLKAISCRD